MKTSIVFLLYLVLFTATPLSTSYSFTLKGGETILIREVSSGMIEFAYENENYGDLYKGLISNREMKEWKEHSSPEEFREFAKKMVLASDPSYQVLLGDSHENSDEKILSLTRPEFK